MGFFTKCIEGGKTNGNHNYPTGAEVYYLEKVRKEQEAEELKKKLAAGPVYPFEGNIGFQAWDGLCTFCKVGCMKGICSSCRPLFERGLRSGSNNIKVKVTTEMILAAANDFIRREGITPVKLVMTPAAWANFSGTSVFDKHSRPSICGISVYINHDLLTDFVLV